MSERKPQRIFSQEFRLSAVQRMLAGETASALAQEPGVLRKSLYEWKDNYATKGLPGLAQQRGRPAPKVIPAPANLPMQDSARGELVRARARIAELERKVGKQELELDFFEAALQRIRALGAKNKEKSFMNSSPIDPSKAS